MSILTANLKHLYQRPGLWPAYVIFGLLAFSSLAIPLDRPLAGKGHFMGLIMLEFLIGLCMASLSVEILTKPFSYCLPGHQAVPRNFVFSVGIVTSLLSSFLFLAYPSLHWWEWVPLFCWSAFCAGLILYLIGVALAFGIRNSSSSLGLLPVLMFGGLFLDAHAVAERMIIGRPFAITFLGLSSSVVVWIWLGNPNWARRLCAATRIGIFDCWNRDKLLEYKRKREAVKWDRAKFNLDPWVERFFVKRINSCSHLGSGRYIWGGLYTTYGMALSRRKGIMSWLLFILAMVVCLSYLRPGGTDALFFMAGVVVAQICLPVHSGMMISGGRSERFVTAVILSVTITVLLSAMLISVAILTVALAPIMPEITFRGELLTFHTMSLRLLVVPSIIIPIVLALRLIIYKKPFATFAAIMMVFMLLFFFGIGSSETSSKLMNPISLVSLLILSWLTLVLVLRHICMKRSLVGQNRTY